MKYYGCKYSLSTGSIKEFDGHQYSNPAYVYDGRGAGAIQHVIGRDAFPNRDDAVGAAKSMRDKKIASLKKQIAKLETLFT